MQVDTTNGLRHGTQFGAPMREELVTVCARMRASGEIMRSRRGENFEMFKKIEQVVQAVTTFTTKLSCHFTS